MVIFKKIISLKKNKPDSVVWDDTQENYIAKLLPYASNISGPIIEVPNVDAFKKKGVDKVSKQFQAELSDLNEKIKSFVSLATYSGRNLSLIQGCKRVFSFANTP